MDPAIITKAVTDLKNIVNPDMLTRFKKLADIEHYAGEVDFMAAQWLEDVVIDRCHGLYEHVKVLQKVFDGLATALDKIKTSISGKDFDAANSLAITEINNWISGATSLTIPPALGKDHYLLNHPNGYTTTDTAGNVVYNLYDIDAHGYALTDGGNIVIDTNDHEDNLAVTGLWDEFYGPLITDINDDPDGVDDIGEDYVMMPEKVNVPESGTK
jgi:hypothetical protein